jgi:hypothetical protein
VAFDLDRAGLKDEYRLCVIVRIRVDRGRIGLGILSADGLSIPGETYVNSSAEACVVELISGPVSESGPLIVRNAAEDGSVSELTMAILAVTITNKC